MEKIPNCPACGSEYCYEARDGFACPECGHEWSAAGGAQGDEDRKIVKDANGTELRDGDTVSVIKDLKVKNSSLVVKIGTQVKNIRLVEGDHDIDCKIPGIGEMQLKSQFVKKVSN